MATIYRKVYTRPLPAGAKTFQRLGQGFARWTDRFGKMHSAPLTPKGDRVVLRTQTWVIRYRDGQGVERHVTTGCRDRQMARQMLADVVKRTEQVKAGIITPQEARTADHAHVPIAEHVDAYLEHLKAKTVRGKRVSWEHRENVQRQLRRLIGDCGYEMLSDITLDSMEKWMNRAEAAGMGARTRNTYRAAIMAFCNWCAETDRLVSSPLDRLCQADVQSDRRRTRRALTEDELCRLLKAARLRPVAEFGRDVAALPPEWRQGRSTWTRAPLSYETLEAAYERGREALRENPGFIAEQDRVGRERSLIYKTLTLTGLRKGELASITVGQLELDAPQPYAELLPKDEKAGRGAKIPLRRDLVADIREHLADRLEALQREARDRGEAIPLRLPLDEPLFNVPDKMIRVFDRDLEAAGIAKQDERGRTVDIHALRHTFGTHLSKNGVAPRTAQAAMRHSKLELTMNVYTDPELLDVAGAMNALPALQIAGASRQDGAVWSDGCRHHDRARLPS